MTHPGQTLLDKIRANNQPGSVLLLSEEERALLPSVIVKQQPIFTPEQEHRIREIMREEIAQSHR